MTDGEELREPIERLPDEAQRRAAIAAFEAFEAFEEEWRRERD
jgi:hypothetical protein